MKPATLKNKSRPVEMSQRLKFKRAKSDHGVESVLVATEKMTVENVQDASKWLYEVVCIYKLIFVRKYHVCPW